MLGSVKPELVEVLTFLFPFSSYAVKEGYYFIHISLCCIIGHIHMDTVFPNAFHGLPPFQINLISISCYKPQLIIRVAIRLFLSKILVVIRGNQCLIICFAAIDGLTLSPSI